MRLKFVCSGFSKFASFVFFFWRNGTVLHVWVAWLLARLIKSVDVLPWNEDDLFGNFEQGLLLESPHNSGIAAPWQTVGRNVFGNAYPPSNQQFEFGSSAGLHRPMYYPSQHLRPKKEYVYDQFDVPISKHPVPVNMVPSRRRFGYDYFKTF